MGDTGGCKPAITAPGDFKTQVESTAEETKTTLSSISELTLDHPKPPVHKAASEPATYRPPGSGENPITDRLQEIRTEFPEVASPTEGIHDWIHHMPDFPPTPLQAPPPAPLPASLDGEQDQADDGNALPAVPLADSEERQAKGPLGRRASTGNMGDRNRGQRRLLEGPGPRILHRHVEKLRLRQFCGNLVNPFVFTNYGQVPFICQEVLDKYSDLDPAAPVPDEIAKACGQLASLYEVTQYTVKRTVRKCFYLAALLNKLRFYACKMRVQAIDGVTKQDLIELEKQWFDMPCTVQPLLDEFTFTIAKLGPEFLGFARTDMDEELLKARPRLIKKLMDNSEHLDGVFDNKATNRLSVETWHDAEYRFLELLDEEGVRDLEEEIRKYEATRMTKLFTSLPRIEDTDPMMEDLRAARAELGYDNFVRDFFDNWSRLSSAGSMST